MKTEDGTQNGMMYQTFKYEDIEDNDRQLQEHFKNEQGDFAMYQQPVPHSTSGQMFGTMKKQMSKYKRKMKDIATIGFKHSPSINEQQVQQPYQHAVDYKFQPLNTFNNSTFEHDLHSDKKKKNKMTEEERKEKNRVYARQHRAEKKKQQKMLEENNKNLNNENKSLRQILFSLGYSIPLQNQMIHQQQMGNNNVPPPDMQNQVMQPPQQFQNLQMMQQQQNANFHENNMNGYHNNNMSNEMNMNFDPNFENNGELLMDDPAAMDQLSIHNGNQPQSSRKRFKTIKKVASSVKNVGMKGGRIVAKAPRAAYNFMFNHHHAPNQNSPPMMEENQIDLSIDHSPQLGSFQPMEQNLDLMDDTFGNMFIDS
mmetsp:Transcript_1342/g.2009  ORF Transcript_1342/g.2009 Transcript_1342/m.2009 type:complete len:368 (+) Transcript_1342:74-1177(+)